VQLQFNSMSDFEPAQIIAQVEPLRRLMETRNKLRDLLSCVDRSEKLENLLEGILSEKDHVEKLAGELPQGDASKKDGDQ